MLYSYLKILYTLQEEYSLLAVQEKFYNSCLCEIVFKVTQKFLYKVQLKNFFFIVDLYKILLGSVRGECFSCKGYYKTKLGKNLGTL